MSIGRTTLSLVLFVAVILGIRWGGNALLQKVITDVKNPKDNWWGKGDNPFQAKPVAGLDFNVHPLDMQKFNEGYLYKPQQPHADRMSSGS